MLPLRSSPGIRRTCVRSCRRFFAPPQPCLWVWVPFCATYWGPCGGTWAPSRRNSHALMALCWPPWWRRPFGRGPPGACPAKRAGRRLGCRRRRRCGAVKRHVEDDVLGDVPPVTSGWAEKVIAKQVPNTSPRRCPKGTCAELCRNHAQTASTPIFGEKLGLFDSVPSLDNIQPLLSNSGRTRAHLGLMLTSLAQICGPFPCRKIGAKLVWTLFWYSPVQVPTGASSRRCVWHVFPHFPGLGEGPC